MKVRVYDKEADKSFKSEVYAIINTGWYERHLVIVPAADGGYLKFFDYMDRSNEENAPKVLINTIVPQRPKEWIHQKVDIDCLLKEVFLKTIFLGRRFLAGIISNHKKI